MLVQQILKSKDNDAVLSVKPDATVAEAVRIMSDKRIGTVVVSADGQSVAGILSERDVVRELGKRGATCLDERVSGMMTLNVSTCGLQDSADIILEMMTVGRFRHLPVMQDGAMVGLVSIGDVVKARLSELSMEKNALQGMIMGY